MAEDHGARHFEARHADAAEGDDLVLNHLGAGLQADEGARRLAPLLVRTGHNNGFHHGGVE